MAVAPEAVAGANITQDTARLAITGANAIFVQALLGPPSSKGWMAERTRGAAVQGINLGDLKRFPVIMPPRSEQDAFAASVSQIDKVRVDAEAQLAGFNALFGSLQHRAFRGELTGGIADRALAEVN
jgi:type I restriction enzyme, S subunit